MTADQRAGASDEDFVERLIAHLDRSAARDESAPADTGTRPDDTGDGDEDAAAASIATVLSSPAVWTDPPDIRATLLARVRAEAARPVDGETSDPVSAPASAPAPAPAPALSPAPPVAAAEPVVAGPAADEPAVATVTPLRRRPSWQRLAVAVPVAAAAAAVLTLAVLGVQDALEPGPDSTFTALGPAGARADVEVTSRASGFEVTLESENLPAAPAGSYYAAWMRRGPGPGDVVPIGTFHGRRIGEPIVLWTGVDPARYRTFSVTLQREGEPPLPNAPSARRVLAGTFGN